MLSNTERPHITALIIEEKLSSRITMSEASLATKMKEFSYTNKKNERIDLFIVKNYSK